MKKYLLPLVTVVLVPTVGIAQSWDATYTRPRIPSRDVLARLNLKEAWHTYIGMDGTHDAIFGVQVLGDQILVQCHSGTVTLLDAQDGTTLWRAQPGKPYMVNESAAHNSRSIFLVRGGELFALDRKTGKIQWHMTLPHGVSATPFADEEHFYLCLLTRELYAYDLPETVQAHLTNPLSLTGHDVEAADLEKAMSVSPRKPGQLPAPEHLWTYSAETRLERAPLATKDLLAISGVDGIYFACTKVNGRSLYRFRADAPVTAPLGQYGDIAFMASQDENVYAVDIPKGRMAWRFIAGGPILQKPEIQDDAVYVSPFRGGLFRVDRATGKEIWRNKTAGRFVAANKKFVYTMDRHGHLLVLDKARGNTLSYLDARAYVFPVSNERTDRILLAANNGLILCLHDRDYPQPIKMKTSPEALRDFAETQEVLPTPTGGKAKGAKK
jgi:outer membrane protein assembly factor BamB